MKKHFVVGLMVLLGMGSMAVASDGWLTDFEKAKAEAAERNVPILVNFSGSDWCMWCVRLDKEVFVQEEFKAYAAENLVLLLADFPSRTAQDKELKAQNKKLSESYEVKGFPTILLLDAEGTVLNHTGYQKGGAATYVEHIKSLLK